MTPAWRTSTVVELCVGMREAQDFSALPILADALQDAGCPEGENLLARLRTGAVGYAADAALVALVLSDETAEAVAWLQNFADAHDCPDYETLLNAATGNHHLNADPENDPAKFPGYYGSENDDEYLHFGGRDAHGEIPPEFWERVELVSGKTIRDRPGEFSCSC